MINAPVGRHTNGLASLIGRKKVIKGVITIKKTFSNMSSFIVPVRAYEKAIWSTPALKDSFSPKKGMLKIAIL